MNDLNEKQTRLRLVLQSNLEALNKAKSVLEYSLQKCGSHLEKFADLNDSELESCEALTARFARGVDILTQKVLVTIFNILQENPVTFIDKCLLAEKIGVIKSAQNLRNMRDLRNEISHEYRLATLTDLIATTVKYSNELCDLIDDVNQYAETLKQK